MNTNELLGMAKASFDRMAISGKNADWDAFTDAYESGCQAIAALTATEGLRAETGDGVRILGYADSGGGIRWRADAGGYTGHLWSGPAPSAPSSRKNFDALLKRLDGLERFEPMRPTWAIFPVMINKHDASWTRFEQVKTVIGQWVADNADLLAIQAEATRLREALKPFAEAFEKHGKFIYDPIQGDADLIDINDENQIHPRGTTMGDYRRAYEALAPKEPS